MRLALGIANYGAGPYPKAAEIFSGLVNQDPENSNYADLLGRSCSNMNESQNAACSQLIVFAEHHPQTPPPRSTRPKIFGTRLAHRTCPARALFTNAIAADPKMPDAYYQMGIIDQEQLQWQASLEPLEKAVSLRPEFASAHYQLARAYSRLKHPEKAATELALQKKIQSTRD